MKRRAGFTLLELLIVVIIVGILAAIAVPQYTKATKKARSSEGAATVDSFLTAEWAYYQENSSFTTVEAELLAEAPVGGLFGYAITSNLTTNVTIIAGPGTNTTVAGVTVTGTMTDAGIRSVTTVVS